MEQPWSPPLQPEPLSRCKGKQKHGASDVSRDQVSCKGSVGSGGIEEEEEEEEEVEEEEEEEGTTQRPRMSLNTSWYLYTRLERANIDVSTLCISKATCATPHVPIIQGSRVPGLKLPSLRNHRHSSFFLHSPVALLLTILNHLKLC